MPREVVILTPENVELRYALAGLGSRFLALFVDVVVQGLAVAGVVAAFSLANVLPKELVSWAGGLLFSLISLIWWGYFIFFEALWSGQTPGKRWAGLRVLRDGGFPVDFRAVLIRNLVRLLDFLPGLYTFGCIAILLHPQCKRLGDMAAGTIVVREREEEEPVSRPTPAETPPSTPVFDPTLVPLHALRPQDLQVLRHFRERREELDAETQQRIARKIAQPLLRRLGIAEEQVQGRYGQFLEELVSWYERQMGV
ncbi:MAG TPA: RDD family protein [Piscirickettsiaceae bacterium]|nr:RDD family protein [Piscirickettsiaceae bacterium]